MKTDLEILIKHLQSEVDYLKSSMDQCISEWDFDGAKAFKTSFIFTKRKLDILQNIHNPNHHKVTRLSQMIPNMEKALDKISPNYVGLDEASRKKLKEKLRNYTQQKIENSKLELARLQAIIPETRMDNDKTLELIELLIANHLTKIDFIIEENILLSLFGDGTTVQLKIIFQDENSYAKYINSQSRSILKKLGFELDTFTRKKENLAQINKFNLLNDLSIIMYEVFYLTGSKEINVEVQ